MKKPHNPRQTPRRERRPENTLLTISLPKKLKDAIATAAASDRRSVSNWLVHLVEQVLDDTAPSSSVAESPTPYKTDTDDT